MLLEVGREKRERPTTGGARGSPNRRRPPLDVWWEHSISRAVQAAEEEERASHLIILLRVEERRLCRPMWRRPRSCLEKSSIKSELSGRQWLVVGWPEFSVLFPVSCTRKADVDLPVSPHLVSPLTLIFGLPVIPGALLKRLVERLVWLAQTAQHLFRPHVPYRNTNQRLSDAPSQPQGSRGKGRRPYALSNLTSRKDCSSCLNQCTRLLALLRAKTSNHVAVIDGSLGCNRWPCHVVMVWRLDSNLALAVSHLTFARFTNARSSQNDTTMQKGSRGKFGYKAGFTSRSR
ncbi:hypothetical protein JOL62DRAFT_213493 [Phyllosticta paracitricarpa]|uniref:Uncharacterized protein n=1 Tax=Phyllosticta paracitricarpa TaxID=2016321 RepID=A0ABR1N055_9PEZI